MTRKYNLKSPTMGRGKTVAGLHYDKTIDFTVRVEILFPMSKIGRPKSEIVRERQIAFFLTKEDADYLDKLSQGLGLKARSTLITGIMEILIEDGFSGLSFARLAKVIHKRLEEHGYPRQLDLKQFFRPDPVLPEVDMTKAEISQFISLLKEDFNNQKKESNVSTSRQAEA